MKNARRLGRVGMLTVGLGIGAAMASTGTASADSGVDPFAFDLNDIAISFNGTTLFQDGTASANSGLGDLAIATGAGSQANSGAGEGFGEPLVPGHFDVAVANGTDSFASAGQGNFDSAFADGTSSMAGVGGDNGVLSNGDWASAVGTHAHAEAGVFYDVPGQGGVASHNDGALVFDPFGTSGSTAETGNGNFDFGSVLGDHSSAFAGFIGSFDLGAVFGNNLSSTAATEGNFLVDILPSLSSESAAATDFSSFATDVSNFLTDWMSGLAF